MNIAIGLNERVIAAKKIVLLSYCQSAVQFQKGASVLVGLVWFGWFENNMGVDLSKKNGNLMKKKSVEKRGVEK